MAEEGAAETQSKKSQPDEKDKIIAALLTANSNHEKHIKLLEKQLSELENKVMAPIRNDAAFLLRLSEIRQSEWEVKDANTSTLESRGKQNGLIKLLCKKTDPNNNNKVIHYIDDNYIILVGDYNLFVVHKQVFNGKPDAIDYLTYTCHIPIMFGNNYKDIKNLLLKTRSNSIEKIVDYNSNRKIHKLTLTTGINSKGTRCLWLEIQAECAYHTFIELDDLTDKELIEKMYKKENLLE